MRLSVSHTTHYHYASPQKRIAQSFRLLPTLCDNQRVLDWAISVEGATITEPFTDGAGDRVCTMTIAGPVTELAVNVVGTVETTDKTGVLVGANEMIVPMSYLRDTPLTMPDEALRKAAQDVATAHQVNGQLALAHALSEACAEHIDYQPGTSMSGDSAATVWAAGKGVCQDQAQALIAMARCVGIPARYVIGYLFATADDLTDEASHAWAELHIDGLGWVGFDVANRCCPDDRYIRLGSGLDAADGAPIRGVAFGSGAERMDINVSVVSEQ